MICDEHALIKKQACVTFQDIMDYTYENKQSGSVSSIVGVVNASFSQSKSEATTVSVSEAPSGIYIISFIII